MISVVIQRLSALVAWNLLVRLPIRCSKTQRFRIAYVNTHIILERRRLGQVRLVINWAVSCAEWSHVFYTRVFKAEVLVELMSWRTFTIFSGSQLVKLFGHDRQYAGRVVLVAKSVVTLSAKQ